MKTNLKLFMGLFILAGLIACSKDVLDDNPPVENPTAVTVKFGNDITVAENAGAQEVTLQFDKTALKAGTIEVKIITTTPDAFQTSPATEDGLISLAIAKGDINASFTVTPADNNLIDEERTVTFEITEVTEGFLIGNKKNSIVTILDDENAVSANFSNDTGVLYENTATGLDIKVQFSAAVFQAGKVILQLEEMPEAGLFTTQPALDANGRVELPVAAGATAVNLLVMPVDNAVIKGHQNLEWNIVETEGGIVKGEEISFSLNLLDDELVGKPQSFETSGGGWRSKKTYLYQEDGAIQAVQWETETPFLRTGTDTYYYAANGLIERVNHYPNEDEYFYQENGRIVRSETIKDGVKKEYSEYDYDPAGNVGGRAQYYRQSDGSYAMSFIFIYLYDLNGNLYSQLTYIPGNDPENPTLISTRTYETYLNTSNPFMAVEVIPGIQAQPFLPASYRIEENGADLAYSFSYEFGEDGKPVKRTVSGAASEVTTYQYY